MCNESARRVAIGQIREDWSQLKIPLRFPEGVPNLEPLDSIRITDPNAIIRTSAAAPGEAERVIRRWSWPGANSKPVYNFRSEGREFRTGRCLIVADAFYEFTDPLSAPMEGKRGKKIKWRFTKVGEDWFCIAGIWRADPKVGEAFTMLTTAPGPDVAPYHDRQVVVLNRCDWPRWLDPAVPARKLLKPSPAGSFAVSAAS
jgi:putative SOS response-associated peptidase YedK